MAAVLNIFVSSHHSSVFFGSTLMELPYFSESFLHFGTADGSGFLTSEARLTTGIVSESGRSSANVS